MNKHIELVKKWLADPDSVSQQELEDNAKAAEAVYEIDRVVDYAAEEAADGNNLEVKFWVNRYDELVREKVRK